MSTGLSKFINKAYERPFCDALVQLIAVEIKQKTGDFDEHMILPAYFKHRIDDGVFGYSYEPSAHIDDMLSKDKLAECRQIIKEGRLLGFQNYQEIKNWLMKRSGFSHCALSAMNALHERENL